MLDTIKPTSFKYGWEFVDPSRIVCSAMSFSLKSLLARIRTGLYLLWKLQKKKARKFGSRYKSEDHAQKARKALWATVHSVNGMSTQAEKQPVVEKVVSRKFAILICFKFLP